MKNIHLLPTEKPSRLWTNNLRRRLELDEFIEQHPTNIAKHIYITSDEFIEEGDFGLNLSTKNIVQYDGIKGLDSYYKKIILTTDQDLIADGVQAIDDEFLEWFVKNPSCEYVEVNFNYKKFRWSELNKSQCYKIIIPQEESKQEGYICPHTKTQCDDECCVSAEDCHITFSLASGMVDCDEPKQETLEEAMSKNGYYESDYDKIWREGVHFGAEWQAQREYNEEDMLNFAEYCLNNVDAFNTPKDLFEQFKKK